MPERLCKCGKPELHYSDLHLQQQMEELVRQLGEFIPIRIATMGNRTFLVPRHYIAQHGIKARDIASLGFEEVTHA